MRLIDARTWSGLAVLVLVGCVIIGVALLELAGEGGASALPLVALPGASGGEASGDPGPAPERPPAAADVASPAGQRRVVAKPFEPPLETRLTVQVLDGAGAPVPDVAVTLVPRPAARGERRRILTDRTGSIVFEHLEAARWYVRLEPESLPEGTAPADGMADTREQRGQAEVEVKPGEDLSVELRIVRLATLEGLVRGPDGTAVTEAWVRLQWLQPRVGFVERTTSTDEDGSFRLEGLLPGAVRLDVSLHHAAPELQALGRPRRERMVLLEGGVHAAPTLWVGAGEGVLTGQLLDQEGIGVAGLPVSCRIENEPGAWPVARTATDGAGCFRLGGLPRVPVLLDVATVSHAHALPGEGVRLAHPVDPLRVDLGALPGEARLEPLLVQVSRPFRIAGSIDISRGSAAAHGVRFQDLRVRIELRDAPPRDLPPDAPTVRFRAHDLDVHEKRGTFSWVCDLPHEPVVLTLVSDAWPIDVAPIVIEPTSGGLAEPVLRCPGP